MRKIALRNTNYKLADYLLYVRERGADCVQNHHRSNNVDAKKSSGGLDARKKDTFLLDNKRRRKSHREEKTTRQKAHLLVGRKRTICGTHAM